jgi:hypothetical protein
VKRANGVVVKTGQPIASDRVSVIAERLRDVAQIDDENEVIGRHETTEGAIPHRRCKAARDIHLGCQMVSETWRLGETSVFNLCLCLSLGITER